MQTEYEYTIDELQQLTPKQEPVRILDLYCGGGGVALALEDIFTSISGRYIGIDITDHSTTYPGEFIQTDASTLTLDDLDLDHPVDLVWASPPCQAYSKLSHIWYDNPQEVHPTFDDLNLHEVCNRLGSEYIIENVVGCSDLNNPITLNGAAFNLDITFTRKFETSFAVDSFTDHPDPNALTVSEDAESDIARAKHIPTDWSKQAIRSAIPAPYVAYLLSHCPSLPEIHPPDDPHNHTYTAQQSPPKQTTLLSNHP